MTFFWDALLAGVGVGSVYAMVALGFSVILKATGAFNFAQGQIVTYGSLLAYSLYAVLKLNLVVVIVVIALASFALGAFVERVAVWPVARRGGDTDMWLLSTIGAGILLTGIAERTWGSQALAVPGYTAKTTLRFGSASVQTDYLVAFVVSIFFVLLIELFQRKTYWGMIFRALGQNRIAVELSGVNIWLLGTIAFGVGGVIAGVGGFVIAPVTYAQSDIGFNLALLAFAGLAIGGFGSTWGALVGGWTVGIVESVGGTYLGVGIEDLVVLGFLVVFLMIRPQGLGSGRALRRV